MTIEEELRTATNFRVQLPEEPRQKYLYALLKAVDTLTADQYDELTDAAYRYCVEAAKKSNARCEIPEPPLPPKSYEDGYKEGFAAGQAEAFRQITQKGVEENV